MNDSHRPWTSSRGPARRPSCSLHGRTSMGARGGCAPRRRGLVVGRGRQNESAVVRPHSVVHMSDLTVPVGQPDAGESELAALEEVLRSRWWTGGKAVAALEAELCSVTGAAYAVALSSGTSAIYGLLEALGCTGPETLVVTSSLNFAAVPASALRLGARIGLTDVAPDTLNMSPPSLEALLRRVRAEFSRVVIVPVHYAGLPADMESLTRIATDFDAVLAEDACHVMGSRYTGSTRIVGSWPGSAGAAFSFHPNKPVAAGEGGAIVTDDENIAEHVRRLRNHNMLREPTGDGLDSAELGRGDPWHYEIHTPGLNLRMSEFHSAVARVQLSRNDTSRSRRATVAGVYDALVESLPWCRTPARPNGSDSSFHLYPVILDLKELSTDRRRVFDRFRQRGVGLQVHYVPLHRQPLCAMTDVVSGAEYPVLEELADGLVSLPLFSHMTEDQVATVCSALASLSDLNGTTP